MAYASEVVELVAHNKVTVTGCDMFLKITSSRFQHLLPEHVTIPRSWHLLKKLAVDGAPVLHTIRHLCPECDYMFPLGSTTARCGRRRPVRCRSKARWAPRTKRGSKQRPARVAVYLDIPDKLQRVFGAQYMFDALLESRRPAPDGDAAERPPFRDRQLNDAADGTHLADRPFDAPGCVTLYYSFTADGVEVQKNVSYTPGVGKNLNLEGTLRSLMSSLLLFCFFPPSVKDYNSLFRPVAELFALHRPGAGRPITVTCATTGRTLAAYLYLAYHVNDIRGVSPLVCGSAPPAHCGSCVRCEVRGIRRLVRTVLPSAVTALRQNDELRGVCVYVCVCVCVCGDEVVLQTHRQKKVRHRRQLFTCE